MSRSSHPKTTPPPQNAHMQKHTHINVLKLTVLILPSDLIQTIAPCRDASFQSVTIFRVKGFAHCKCTKKKISFILGLPYSYLYWLQADIQLRIVWTIVTGHSFFTQYWIFSLFSVFPRRTRKSKSPIAIKEIYGNLWNIR